MNEWMRSTYTYVMFICLTEHFTKKSSNIWESPCNGKYPRNSGRVGFFTMIVSSARRYSPSANFWWVKTFFFITNSLRSQPVSMWILVVLQIRRSDERWLDITSNTLSACDSKPALPKMFPTVAWELKQVCLWYRGVFWRWLMTE
jgi:hypothetical protein